MITPIIFNPIENNPYFWWNGLEIPIQLKYLFEQVMRHDITIKELVDAVNKFNEEFEHTIEQEVIDKINEMYESGQLAQIVGEVVANSMTGKTGDIDLYHMGYVLHRAHTYGVSTLPDEDAALTYQEELYSALQGNCVFEINGNLFWACCYVCQNGSQYDNVNGNNSINLYVYTINNDMSLSYVTNKEFAVIGHANSMTFNNGYLYITPNSYQGSGGGSTTDVHRIAFDGETLGGTWHPESQTYRAETKTPTGWIYDTAFSDNISAYNGVIYICDQFKNVYTYDWNTNTVTLLYERINGIYGGASGGDGLSVTENYIYFGCNNSFGVKRYNRSLGYVDWVYNIPRKPNQGAYKLGEVEGLTVIDGILYVGTFYNLCGTDGKTNTYSITHFYCQNLATNNIPIQRVINWSSSYNSRRGSFYVQGDLPTDDMNSLNDYFNVPCVQVAVDFIETNDMLQRGTISVRQYRNLSTIEIVTTKPIIIDGSYYRNTMNPGTNPSIGHIHILQNADVLIKNINIDNRLPADINNNIFNRNCIYCLGSVLNIEGVGFPTGKNTNAINVRFAIEFYRGLLNARTNDSYATNPEAWVNYREAEGVTNPEYVGGYTSVKNINGTITGN